MNKKDVLEKIRQYRSNGVSGDEIALRLNALGITTPSGKQWSKTNVSQFAKYNGLPRLRRKYRRTKSAVNKAQKPAASQSASKSVVKELLASNMNEKSKLYLLNRLLLNELL